MNKYFDKNHILKDVDLTIEVGDLIKLLGPPSCSKTTTVRFITGLENPEAGTMDGGIPLSIYSVMPACSETLFQMTSNGDNLILAKVIGELDYQIGKMVWVTFSLDKVNVYDKETGVLVAGGKGSS